MSKLPGASLLTAELRLELDQISAVVSNHPDEMYRDKYNPDIAHFNVVGACWLVVCALARPSLPFSNSQPPTPPQRQTKTPIMIITGSSDTTIEEKGSAWRDFQMLRTPDKVFVDVKGADHSEPVEGHRMGGFIAAVGLDMA